MQIGFAISCLLVLFAQTLFAQQKNLPLYHDMMREVYLSIGDSNHVKHTSVKPLLENRFDLTNVHGYKADSSKYYYGLTQKLFKENLIIIDEDDFKLTIDPLFNFGYTYDFADTTNRQDSIRYLTNTRGFLVRGDIGKNVSFESSFLENQQYFTSYQNEFVATYGVVPGSGRVKPFKVGGYDYAMARGYVSYSPSANFNVQFGHGKHAIGDGYRSLLLSDNSFNYPYLRFQSNFLKGKLSYNNIFAFLQSLERYPLHTTPEATFKRKTGTFHHLNFAPNSQLSIGVFEGIIWQQSDSISSQPVDGNAYIPIIFLNSVINQLDGLNNVILGINMRYQPYASNVLFYSQLMLDDSKTDKYGYQIGVHFLDGFSINRKFGIPLALRLEYNSVSKYSYTNQNTLQNYSHYNQPLAHPQGAGFDEFIVQATYHLPKWRINYQMNSSKYDANNGHNIFFNDNSAQLPSNNTELRLHHLGLQYLMNPKTNMNIYFGYTHREIKSESANHETSLISLGIRTFLLNTYFDF